MGLWGAAQAIAFGMGGFLGTALVDVAQWIGGPSGLPYAFVFGLEALGFVVAPWLALKTSFGRAEATRTSAALPSGVLAESRS